MSIQDTLPKSRLTLRYRTEINGEPEDIELPLRLLLVGDFSGSSTEKEKFEERKILSFDGKNLNSVMQKMKIRLSVTDSDNKVHTIPIENVDSFLPGNVIKSISTMDDMVKSKQLLNSLLSNINNSSKFRRTLSTLLAEPEAMTKLKDLMAPSYKKIAEITKDDSKTANPN